MRTLSPSNASLVIDVSLPSLNVWKIYDDVTKFSRTVERAEWRAPGAV
jgi:hypothetical protein